MISSVCELPPGAIAYGRSGVPYEVLECRSNCVALRQSDGKTIEVRPTAILRWEVPKISRAESKVKILSEPSESTIKSPDPSTERLLASDDIYEKYRPNIVRQAQLSSENLSIVRKESLMLKGFQPSSDGLDSSDDIFTLLSVQTNFGNFKTWPPDPGDRVKLKNTKLEYVITKIYDHFMGLQDGEPSYEQWAKLRANDGNPAQWKLNQLEKIQ
jgi:hypothetical protein